MRPDIEYLPRYLRWAETSESNAKHFEATDNILAAEWRVIADYDLAAAQLFFDGAWKNAGSKLKSERAIFAPGFRCENEDRKV